LIYMAIHIIVRVVGVLVLKIGIVEVLIIVFLDNLKLNFK